MSVEADQILASVKAAYAGCRSYRDEGVVTTTFYSPSKRTERRPFSTRFVRPDGFMFEFRSRRGEDDWDQYAVWIEGGRPRTWWTAQPGRDDPGTLGLAIAGATGISGGAAHRVPHLLMPELNKNGERPAPPEASLIAVPDATSQNCVVVEHPRGFGSTEQIWIDSSSFLIRRVVEPRHVLGPPPPEAIERLKASHPERAAEIAKRFEERAPRDPVEVESVTTYEAAFDAEVEPREMLYVPPAG